MGAVPSKVGSSLRPGSSGDKMFDQVPMRAQSSLSMLKNSSQFSPLWRPTSAGFRKLYRKNSHSDLRANNNNNNNSGMWFGSTGVLHQDLADCRRCDALFNLCCDKDIIIGSLESMVADMRIKLAAYDNQLREVRSRAHSKRQLLTLKLFEFRERICYLEELCASNKISMDNIPSRSKHCESSLASDGDSEIDDDDDGLKHQENKPPHSQQRHNMYSQRPSTSGSSVEKTQPIRAKATPHRSTSAVQYRRRPSTAGSNTLGSQNQLHQTPQHSWAIAGFNTDSLGSDSISAQNSPRSRYEPRRSATISAGSYAAMTGQSRRRI